MKKQNHYPSGPQSGTQIIDVDTNKKSLGNKCFKQISKNLRVKVSSYLIRRPRRKSRKLKFKPALRNNI